RGVADKPALDFVPALFQPMAQPATRGVRRKRHCGNGGVAGRRTGAEPEHTGGAGPRGVAGRTGGYPGLALAVRGQRLPIESCETSTVGVDIYKWAPAE